MTFAQIPAGALFVGTHTAIVRRKLDADGYCITEDPEVGECLVTGHRLRPSWLLSRTDFEVVPEPVAEDW